MDVIYGLEDLNRQYASAGLAFDDTDLENVAGLQHLSAADLSNLLGSVGCDRQVRARRSERDHWLRISPILRRPGHECRRQDPALIAQYEEAQLRDRLEAGAAERPGSALIADLKRLLSQDEGPRMDFNPGTTKGAPAPASYVDVNGARFWARRHRRRAGLWLCGVAASPERRARARPLRAQRAGPAHLQPSGALEICAFAAGRPAGHANDHACAAVVAAKSATAARCRRAIRKRWIGCARCWGFNAAQATHRLT